MGSTSLEGKPQITRKNTFQRMLDLEQKTKMYRMRTSQKNSLVHTSRAPGQVPTSNSSSDSRPATLEATGRAMTTPTLSISIPTKMSTDGTTTKYVINQNGDLITQEEESDGDTDASSICHSPGWDAAAAKKKKEEKKAKQKRRREKEKAEKEAMQAEKTKARLSKVPPSANSSKKLSRMSVTIDRSNTAPVLPTAGNLSTPAEETSQSRESTSTTRPRRGSVEVGFKSFMSARSAIPVPWKTSNNTSAQTTPTQEFVSFRTTSKAAGGGFIGGLKLRQSEEAATQEFIRKVKTGGGDDAQDLLGAETMPNSSTASIADSRPISLYEEFVRTPQQWDSIYSQAAVLGRGHPTNDAADDNSSIMERNDKKSRKKHPPTSRYFPLEGEDSNSSKRASSIASTRNSVGSGTLNGEDKDDRPATANRNSSLDPPRGRSGNYVGHQRNQSRDQSLAGYQDEVHVSEANKGSKRGSSRSSFFRRSSRARESSRDAPSTVRPGTRDNSIDAHAKQTVATNPFLSDEYILPQLHLGDFTASPLDEKPTHHRQSSSKLSQTFPGLKTLKETTKAAFSKQSGETQLAPPSPTGSFVSAVESHTLRLQASQHALTTSAIDGKDPSTKAAGVLAENVTPPIIQDFAVRSHSSSNTSPDISRVWPSTETSTSRKESGRSTPNWSNGHSSTTSHSRSVTDSSEEGSAAEEFSNITTPAISRPHSEMGYFPTINEIKQKSPNLKEKSSKDRGTVDRNADGHPVMTGAVPLGDVASARDSWCRTAMPMDLDDGEDRMKTPTGFRSQQDKSATPKPSDGPLPKSLGVLGNSGVQRTPSLSRSISTPELQQDLSFLPPLKHQPLTKPQKKGKGILGRRNKQASVDSDNEGPSPTTMVRPPPLTVPGSTKSEGSSPTSPQPSQYLQNARLNISGPRSPKSGVMHSGNTHLSAVGGNSEPIAKMFVVCCSCKYFHDMPSKIYECMAKPDNVVTDPKLGVSGLISTTVKCPWCGHGMNTSCCSGYAAVVYLREKFH